MFAERTCSAFPCGPQGQHDALRLIRWHLAQDSGGLFRRQMADHLGRGQRVFAAKIGLDHLRIAQGNDRFRGPCRIFRAARGRFGYRGGCFIPRVDIA